MNVSFRRGLKRTSAGVWPLRCGSAALCGVRWVLATSSLKQRLRSERFCSLEAGGGINSDSPEEEKPLQWAYATVCKRVYGTP